MHAKLRLALALTAFLFAAPALADVTITGTVGEIGTLNNTGLGSLIRFKLTNVNVTAGCVDPNNNGAGAGYVWFLANPSGQSNETFSKEWYAMLLYSKKGAPITCTLNLIGGSYTGCHVTTCTLP